MGSPQLAFSGFACPYVRRQPEQTVLYQVVLEHWETFRAQIQSHGGQLPPYVEQEFESFLACGILGKGFLRVQCEACFSERLVAFSCKKRGFCPSCGGRRMAETAALLVDDVLPRVPYRQWVLSVPFPLRFWLARRPDLLSVCLRVVHRAIGGWYKRRAQRQGHSGTLKTGAVTFLQRYGSKLNLNPHFHMLFMDGVMEVEEEGVRFHRTPVPTDEDVVELVRTISTRVIRALQRRGFFCENPERDESCEPLELISALYAGSIQGRSVLTPRRTPQGQAPFSVYGKLCAQERGFSLHGATSVAAQDRTKLEKLCRYMARPAMSNERLHLSPDQRHVILTLKQPFRDGTSQIPFTPLELIEKLAALVPPPRTHLVRYVGILGPHDAHRALVVPGTKHEKGPGRSPEDSAAATSKRLSWAKLLARVFRIDVDTCQECGGQTKIIAAITQKAVIQKILDHLGLSSDVPTPAPARAPPQERFDFNQTPPG